MTHELSCNQQPALVDLLYEECEPEERRRLQAHVAVCGVCATELRRLRSVQRDLQAWSPPEQELGFRIVQERARVETFDATSNTRRDPVRSRWAIPSWAAAAAAALVLAAGAAIANLEVRYGGDGLTVRTGWKRPAPVAAPAAVGVGDASPQWRSELASLERRLRREFSSQAPASVAPLMSARAAERVSADRDAELMRRVRTLIDENNRQVRRELALRLTDFARDSEATRRADLVRIERGLGTLQRETGLEVGRQREALNYLITRVAAPGSR